MYMLKVKFVDFSSDNMKNRTMKILKQAFKDVEESEEPDFLFYSVFGHEYLKYNCVRIFWTGENIQPDFNVCDYAIGFSYLEYEDRYKRIPLYYFYEEDYKNALQKNVNGLKRNGEKKFCNFVYSNGSTASPERELFFDKLNNYKKVDSGGKYRNNVGGPVKDKYEFQKQYKFSIAFENSSTNGYTTEKIIQAFAAGTIPIYWGNPKIERDFNPKAFINCHNFENFEQVIERIKEIDQDDRLYDEYMRQPIGEKDLFPDNPLEEYAKYIIYICSQDPQMAMRRCNIMWGKLHQDGLKKYYRYQDFLDIIIYKNPIYNMGIRISKSLWVKIKNIIKKEEK